MGEFEDWFYEYSVDALDSDVSDLVASIDSALSARHFENLKQKKLREQLQELANASRPFAVKISLSVAPLRRFEVVAGVARYEWPQFGTGSSVSPPKPPETSEAAFTFGPEPLRTLAVA